MLRPKEGVHKRKFIGETGFGGVVRALEEKAGATDHLEVTIMVQGTVSLRTQPLKTLRLCSTYIVEQVLRCLKQMLAHPVTLFFITPMAFSLAGLKFLGAAKAEVDEFQVWAEYVIWWVGLGVLSSVGLGSGLHSGVLFLIPHILKVCLAAERCGNTSFDVRTDAWLNSDPMHCDARQQPAAHVSFWAMYGKIAGSGLLWGAGTAIGEIPPFLFSLTAAMSGAGAGSIEGVEPQSRSILGRVLANFRGWMISLIRRHGFLAVLLLASWPNAAFDLCGIFCGAVQMPFWSFFGATLIGKGIVKVNGQMLCCLTLFERTSRDRILAFVERALPERVPYVGLSDSPGRLLHAFIEKSVRKFQDSVASQAAAQAADTRTAWDRLQDVTFGNFDDITAWKEWAYMLLPDTFKEIWGLVMAVVITYFVVNFVDALAQIKLQQLVDHDKKAKQS